MTAETASVPRAGSPAEAVRAGLAMSESAFQDFHARTVRRLWAYAARGTGDPALADDLVQEAYYRFLRAGFVGRDHDHRKNYLFRIVTNLMRDRGRSRRPLERRERLDALDEGVAVTAGPAATAELRTDLERVLPALPERDRQLLWLAHVEELEHREIAEIVGVREKSVRVLLFRIRKRVAASLREQGIDGVARRES